MPPPPPRRRRVVVRRVGYVIALVMVAQDSGGQLRVSFYVITIIIIIIIVIYYGIEDSETVLSFFHRDYLERKQFRIDIVSRRFLHQVPPNHRAYETTTPRFLKETT